VDVLDLVTGRRDAGFRPGIDSDGNKLGLAVEGGGMRGVVSGAMLIALTDLGLSQVFDGFYGTSSGALNLAYYLSGDTWRALSMYYDYLARSDFVSVTRPLRGGPIVAIDLILEIMDGPLKIDWEAVLKASESGRFVVGLSRLDPPAPELRTRFGSVEELRAALRVGAWLPILAGGPQTMGGHQYVDGGVFFANPWYAAIQDGCTHVLQLATRPVSMPRTRISAWQRVLARRLDRWSRGAGDLYLRTLRTYLSDSSGLGYREGMVANARILRVAALSGGHEVKRLTTNREVLLEGARAGYGRMMELFEGAVGDVYFSLQTGPRGAT
jgi:predicted patatin/cPLA2 family phospholipase